VLLHEERRGLVVWFGLCPGGLQEGRAWSPQGKVRHCSGMESFTMGVTHWERRNLYCTALVAR